MIQNSVYNLPDYTYANLFSTCLLSLHMNHIRN